jgi:hypothetical protein
LEFCRDREADMLRFITGTRIWPTNNISERDLRPTKTQQKISGRLTSEDVTQDRLDIRSYIDTARKHGINVMTALSSGHHRKPLAAIRADSRLNRRPFPRVHSGLVMPMTGYVNVYLLAIAAGDRDDVAAESLSDGRPRLFWLLG